MFINRLNRYLLSILVLGWLSFLVAGTIVNQVFATPNIVLLVDRGYCPAQKWQQVAQTYADLYRQHQQQHLHLESVILSSDLGKQVLSVPPTPEELGNLRTYGRSNPQRIAQLTQVYLKTKVLSCPP